MERFDLYPAKLIGDSAYGGTEMLHWLVNDQGIEPHVPVSHKSKRTDSTFSRDDFTYEDPTHASSKSTGSDCGPNGARGEFHLAATAQNLRKLAKLIPTPLPRPI
jgi:hypothetical protein